MSPKVEAIVDEVIAARGVGRREALSRGNNGTCLKTLARWEIWSRVRSEVVIDGKPASWPWIGRQFGFHHTSVMYGVRRYLENTNVKTWRAAA